MCHVPPLIQRLVTTSSAPSWARGSRATSTGPIMLRSHPTTQRRQEEFAKADTVRRFAQRVAVGTPICGARVSAGTNHRMETTTRQLQAAYHLSQVPTGTARTLNQTPLCPGHDFRARPLPCGGDWDAPG